MCSDFADTGRPNVPIRKLSPSRSIKTEVHAPGCSHYILRIEAYGLMKSHSDFYFMRTGVRLLCSYKETKAALLPECRNCVLNFYAFLMNTSRRSRPLSISVSEVA